MTDDLLDLEVKVLLGLCNAWLSSLAIWEYIELRLNIRFDRGYMEGIVSFRSRYVESVSGRLWVGLSDFVGPYPFQRKFLTTLWKMGELGLIRHTYHVLNCNYWVFFAVLIDVVGLFSFGRDNGVLCRQLGQHSVFEEVHGCGVVLIKRNWRERPREISIDNFEGGLRRDTAELIANSTVGKCYAQSEPLVLTK